MVNRVLWYRVNRIRLRSDSVIAPLYPAFRINESIATIFVQPKNEDAAKPKTLVSWRNYKTKQIWQHFKQKALSLKDTLFF